MLEVRDLTVSYGTLTAVRDVSLRVGVGEIVAVVGPNGAGKSTTLSAVAGLLRPGNGTIEFQGREIRGESPENIVRRGIALVPEGRHIFSSLTVEENLMLRGHLPHRSGWCTAIAR
ncbi:ATP-binding cassette domain-containing protein [Nocardioides sp. B-3]|uniref:ATP-binding cassette domain-containing protein n=1 Tax=Nocardioides sp. B-3 TaxID=2895565 RepID=UPI002152B9BC|nr:ATP-binding cassette domain-containing protein [Nocardioides sp. B-3]